MDAPDSGPRDIPGTHSADSVSLAGEAIADLYRAVLAVAHLARAELRLARSSLIAAIGFAVATLVFALGTWIGLNSLVFVAVQAWTGNLLLGAVCILAANLGGGLWCYARLRRCLHDVGLPRTRRLLAGSPAGATTASRATP